MYSACYRHQYFLHVLVMTLFRKSSHIGIKDMLKWLKLFLSCWSLNLEYNHTLSCILKNAGMFWWRQCWWNQIIEAKATRALQRSHIFVNVEGHEDIVCFRNVFKYMINELQHWRKSWVGCNKIHTWWNKDCKSYLTDVSSIIEDFSLLYRFSLKISLKIWLVQRWSKKYWSWNLLHQDQ